MTFATFDKALAAAEALLVKGGPEFDPLAPLMGVRVSLAQDGAGYGVDLGDADLPATVYANGSHHPADVVHVLPGTTT